MLSPSHHPCQALADLLTMREAFGAIAGRRLAYVGDGNNVARSLAILGALADVEVVVAAPEGFQLARGPRRPAHRRPGRGGRGRRRRLHRRLGVDERQRRGGRRPPRGARPPTGSTTRCSTARRPARSRCTACPRTRARRSPSPCSTATASGSGTRPRTAATRRRRCWSSSFRELQRRGRDGPDQRGERDARAQVSRSRPPATSAGPRRPARAPGRRAAPPRSPRCSASSTRARWSSSRARGCRRRSTTPSIAAA